MNDELLETANLHVLGLLTGDDGAAFERELRSHPDLRAEVHALQEATLALARSVPQVAPPAALRDRILAGFPSSGASEALAREERVVPPSPVLPATAGQSAAPPPSSPLKLLHFIPWAAAAAMAVLFYQNRDAISAAQAQTRLAESEAAAANQQRKQYQEAVALSESARSEAQTSLTETRSQLAAAGEKLQSLSGEQATLTAELASLRKDSALDQTRIAVLGSLLKNQPKAVAVSLWRQERQEGLLVVENLPSLPAGRDYQLWVIDPNLKTPVSAGVFKVDNEGKVRIEFKPDRRVQSAYKFAVTVEKEGGAVVPTMDQMVVIGG